ncbi:MAG: IS1634 family transposase [Candidatus Hydrothermarchaeota archaeon]
MASRLKEVFSRIERETVKVLGAAVLIKPFLDGIKVAEIVNSYTSDGSEIRHGDVIEILTINRLTAPRPLYYIEHWAKGTAIEEIYGLDWEKLNDDRCRRSLQAIFPHLSDIWTDIVTSAVVKYNIPIDSIIYDLTSLYFEGEYEESKIIEYGYSRDKKPEKVQVNLGVNVTQDKIPLTYDLHAGSTADRKTVLDNMRKLQELREKLADQCKEPLLITGDGKTISDEIVIKYHEKGVQYLAPVEITEERKEIVLSVTEGEFEKHKLDYKDRSKGTYWGVFRPITFKYNSRTIIDKVMVVKSETKLKRDRKNREKAINRIKDKLKHIESKLNQRKYKNKDYVKMMAKKAIEGSRAKKYFYFAVKGEYGNLSFKWGLQYERIKEDEKLDGKYMIATNKDFDSEEVALTTYKGRNKVEQRISTLKSTLRIRPLFLEKDEMIASLVFVIMLSLLIYSIIEMLCRKQLENMTARKAFFAFEYLSIICYYFRDCSKLVKVSGLGPPQDEILSALGIQKPNEYIDYC